MLRTYPQAPSVQHVVLPQNFEEKTEGLFLTIEEKSRLRDCEKIISIGLHAFVEVGNALIEIRNQKLYRVNFQTFEHYCRERWQLKRQRAYEMMEAAEIVQSLHDSLSEISDKLPQKESHAAQLVKIPVEERPKVWKEIIDNCEILHQPVTAKRIAEAIHSHKNHIQVADEGLRILIPLPPESLPNTNKQEDKKISEEQYLEIIKKIKAKIINATPREIMVQVSGKWLIRNQLSEIWKTARQMDKHLVITEDYKDYLTIEQAQRFGLVEKPIFES